MAILREGSPPGWARPAGLALPSPGPPDLPGSLTVWPEWEERHALARVPCHIVVTIDGREWTIVLEGENVDVGTGHIHVRGSSHIHVDSGCA